VVNRVNPSTIYVQDSENETTHEEVQEVQDQDQEDLGWSMVFEQVMEDKKQRRAG